MKIGLCTQVSKRETAKVSGARTVIKCFMCGQQGHVANQTMPSRQ